MESQVAQKLFEKSIRYKWVDGVLCADVGSYEAVRLAITSVVERVLNPGSSASLHREIHLAVVSELKKKKISFEEIEFQGDKYLVWHQEDSYFVEGVINREKEKFIESMANKVKGT